MNVGIEKVVYNIIYIFIYIVYNNCIFPIGTKKLIVSC